MPPSIEHTAAAPCTHQECRYLQGHGSSRCGSCGGTVHAAASNWDDYSFGHSGGHVAFLTTCSSCGKINTGHVLGVEWSEAEMAAAEKLRPPTVTR